METCQIILVSWFVIGGLFALYDLLHQEMDVETIVGLTIVGALMGPFLCIVVDFSQYTEEQKATFQRKTAWISDYIIFLPVVLLLLLFLI